MRTFNALGVDRPKGDQCACSKAKYDDRLAPGAKRNDAGKDGEGDLGGTEATDTVGRSRKSYGSAAL